MKQFLKILKFIPSVLARIAHVIEHIFCDEVPHISYEDSEDESSVESPSFDEDLYLSESRSFSDVDPYLDSDLAELPDDLEDDL